MRKNTYLQSLLFVMFFCLGFILQGCSQQPEVGKHSNVKHSNESGKPSPSPSFLSDEIMPLSLEEGEFYKAAGWMDDERILYIANLDSGSALYTHHIFSGEQELLYKNGRPIITAEISPDKNYILIHSSDSSKGYVSVIDTEGKEQFSAEIPSHELNFEWNPFTEKKIFLSAFTEDWEFTDFIMDLDKKELKEIALPEPFARWVSEEELVLQDWHGDDMSLNAPLVSFSLTGEELKQVFPNIFQFDTIGKSLLTVTTMEEDSNKGKYTLYHKGFKQIGEMKVPLLTSFSGWLVPFYDLMNDGKDFIYLRALHEGEADVYDDGFQLVRYSLESNEEKVIVSGLENEPLSCAPSGPLCLYGYQSEKILDVESGKVTNFVQ